jgi:hypothetical protein
MHFNEFKDCPRCLLALNKLSIKHPYMKEVFYKFNIRERAYCGEIPIYQKIMRKTGGLPAALRTRRPDSMFERHYQNEVEYEKKKK